MKRSSEVLEKAQDAMSHRRSLLISGEVRLSPPQDDRSVEGVKSERTTASGKQAFGCEVVVTPHR